MIMRTHRCWRLCKVAVLLLTAALRVEACDVAQWSNQIAQASRRFEVNSIWIRAVIRVESDACATIDGRLMTSWAGAMGLMQIMPATWHEYRDRLRLGDNPYRPDDNILAGTAYLGDLIARYGVRDALAAYYAGPTTVDAALARSGELPQSVERYVERVLRIASASEPDNVSELPQVGLNQDALFAIVRSIDASPVRERTTDQHTIFAIVRPHAMNRTDDDRHAAPVQRDTGTSP